jgi:hypothetical protein
LQVDFVAIDVADYPKQHCDMQADKTIIAADGGPELLGKPMPS